MPNEQLLSQVESILFVSGEPVELKHLKEVLDLSETALEELIKGLKEKYRRADSGLSLRVTGSTIQLVSKAENYEWVQKTLKTEKKRPLSQAAYEVLAIITYTQPVTRTEIEAVRGVNSTSALQHLLDLGLVVENGRKDVPGNPYLYETTEQFLQCAGIKALSELPSYESFKEKLTDINE